MEDNWLKLVFTSGEDGISSKLLKEAGYSLVPTLAGLLNKSLQLGKFPADWKRAIIVPIHKKDDKSEVSNYRPISLLSVTNKTMERIIFKHIYNFYHCNNRITIHQSGFRPNDCTVGLFIQHNFQSVGTMGYFLS